MKMKKILISGLLNVESSLFVDSFPLDYFPICYPFHGISSHVSGVGYNLSKGLSVLGDDVSLLSLLGNDLNGKIILSHLQEEGIKTENIKIIDGDTPQSIVIVDRQGKRQIHCDLKDIQSLTPFEDIPGGEFDMALLTNINFSLPLLRKCKEKGIKIATDVHVLSSLEDEYNRPFMENADILFLSNEAIKGKEGEFIASIYRRYHNPLIVVGCGEEGALAYLGETDTYLYEPSFAPFVIKSTVGAGDCLFASFIHAYLSGRDISACLRFAVISSGIKISSSGGGEGYAKEEIILRYL